MTGDPGGGGGATAGEGGTKDGGGAGDNNEEYTFYQPAVMYCTPGQVARLLLMRGHIQNVRAGIPDEGQGDPTSGDVLLGDEVDQMNVEEEDEKWQP